jgi:hypothetical protein
MALADESGLSRNCAEAAGLPPATLRHKQELYMTSCLDQLSRNGPIGPSLEVNDDDDRMEQNYTSRKQ